MGGLVWVGFIAFFVVALVVGVRVLMLARRTRELPELLMGIGVLGIGPVGFGLQVAAQHVGDPTLQVAVLAVAMPEAARSQRDASPAERTRLFDDLGGLRSAPSRSSAMPKANSRWGFGRSKRTAPNPPCRGTSGLLLRKLEVKC